MKIIEQNKLKFNELLTVYQYVQQGARISDNFGDMKKAVYDPTSVAGDVFDMDNMSEGVTNKILSATERAAIAANTSKVSFPEAPNDGKPYDRKSLVWVEAADLLAIKAQGWVELDYEGVGVSFIINAGFSEITGLLPFDDKTTTISIAGLPTNQPYIVLNLITRATFNEPIWSGIDATEITLDASTTHKIAIYAMQQTSGSQLVAILMHKLADA